MSRYLILFLMNLPFILVAMLSAITKYKLRKSSRRRMIAQLIIWSFILIGLTLAQTAYRFLYRNNLTQTEPLSLFDVVQITGIVITFYVANATRARVGILERRLNDLHQELSINLSGHDSKSRIEKSTLEK